MADQEHTTLRISPEENQLLLPLYSVETYVLQRGFVGKSPWGSYERASLDHREKHRLLYTGGNEPILDMTDGYFNASEWLVNLRFFSPFYASILNLSCVKAMISMSLNDVHFVDSRILNKTSTIWFHPYLTCLYMELFQRIHTQWNKIDARTLQASYVLCALLEGKDYFQSYQHFCIDTDIHWNSMDLFPLFMQHSESEKKEEDIQPSYVYVIQRSRTRDMKIGHSNKPKERLKGLQTGCPDDLFIRYMWEVTDAAHVEHALHVKFAYSFLQGEWFTLSQKDESDLLRYMEKCSFKMV